MGGTGGGIADNEEELIEIVIKGLKYSMGGIASAEDAIEFLLAGASAVSIGTANFVDPGIAEKISTGIDTYLRERGIRNVAEIVGALKL